MSNSLSSKVAAHNRQPLGDILPAQQPGDISPVLEPPRPFEGILPPNVLDLTPPIGATHLTATHTPGTPVIEQGTLRHAEAPELPASLQ